MDRREFLRLGGFVTVSIATGAGGCATDIHPPPPGPATPATPSAPPTSAGTAPKPTVGLGWRFPQSVASGDPKPDSILLWARIAPATANDVETSASIGDLLVRVAVTEADNASSLGTDTELSGTKIVDAQVPAYTRYDHTVRHKVVGLSPNKVYYYQFTAGSVRSNVGRFKTAPAADSDNTQLKVCVLACQDWTIHHWGAFDEIVAHESVDFVLHTGDYIYETTGAAFQTGAVESAHDALEFPDGATIGSGTEKHAVSLADYRYLYKKYRSDHRLQALHERYAFVAVWDDHEFSDDCWRDASTYENGSFFPALGGDNKHEPERRRAANQAWFEYMLADVTFNPNALGFENVSIYRDLKFGKLAHLVVTDERLYRSDHLIPEAAPNPATGQPVGSIGSRYFVPEPVLNDTEGKKIAAATGLGADSLALVTMLGKTQRDWWKEKMTSSASTWKLWGNEVSLLRIGLSGTDAIATLLALNSIQTLATQIGTTAGSTGGNVPVAAAIVAAVSAGASQSTAAAGATAIATADATAGNKLSAAVGAGLTTTQAGIAVATFDAAKAAAAGGATAQAGAGAQVIAFGLIKPDIQANKQNSPFVIAAGRQVTLAPFFTKFLIQADQWDGYNAERKDLMKHLKDNNIKNVVALTGDLHAFLAGTVNDDYQASNGGTPVMVDLVTAGVSSDSFFTYLRDRVGGVSADLAALVTFPLNIPVTGLGTVSITFNLLDYTFGKAAPTVDSLAEQARVRLRGALADKGVPEAQLDATTTAVLTGLKASSAFNTNLLGLATQLASLNSNPWLKYVNTDAQGYAIVTITPTSLTCQLKQVNRLVHGEAPSTVVANVATATVAKDTAAVTIS
jgi:alkaline phosphatase D